jgi:thioredoxin reductase
LLCVQFKKGADQGVQIDDRMRTSVGDVFACGDAAFAGFAEHQEAGSHWFQVDSLALHSLCVF